MSLTLPRWIVEWLVKRKSKISVPLTNLTNCLISANTIFPALAVSMPRSENSQNCRLLLGVV